MKHVPGDNSFTGNRSLFDSGRCIIFAPHQDDAVLGCGAMIRSKTLVGAEIFVVCMTDGSHSHLLTFGIKDNPTPLELNKCRETEEKAALRLLGVPAENIRFLNFEDGLLYKKKREAIIHVKSLLEELRPVMVFGPYRKDKHPDHVATYAILSECVDKAPIAPLMYEYFIWSTPPVRAQVYPALIRIEILGDLQDTKQQAIAQYTSQIGLFSSEQSRPVLNNDFLKRFRSGSETFLLTSTFKDSALKKFCRSVELWVKTTAIEAVLFLRK